MEHTKKYLVVPYVKNIEKPSESYLQNINQNMDQILYDNKLAPDIKLKLYSKSLNNFLLKYDPDSFGLAPTLTKLAKVITNYLNNANDPKVIEKDLKPLFDSPKDYKHNLFEKNQNDKNSYFNQNTFDYHNKYYQSDNDSINTKSPDKLDTNITFDQSDEENEEFQTVSNDKSLNNTNQSEILASSSNYPPTSTKRHTRSQKLPLKSPLQSSKRAKKEDKKENLADSFLNKDSNNKNKYKNNNTNPNKSGSAKASPFQKEKNQVANGLWKTKRFF